MVEKSIEFKTIHKLEQWLANHYTEKDSVWLVYYKPTTKIGDITYTTLVDTLLCYGWVDSLPRKVDDLRTAIRISPRNPKSNWSRVNKEKVAKLIKEKRMQPSGLAIVNQAKKLGTWDALNDVENLVLPEDLKLFLQKSKTLPLWEKQSRTKKRGWLEQLHNAKKEETRTNKIKQIFESLKLH
ncbi:MAG: hypothetical protein RLZZ360_758 [Candidatus Parcubacteria bacterium]|jgi:uncharacterized protein YdeI (YjbR/CyaY-like superfamily)